VPRLRRPLAVLLALLASGGLAACGNHPDENARVVRAETEGLYLDVGDLKYQVQVSRQLNPRDIQDRSYLVGIPAGQQTLKPDEVWFGVFMRIQNETSHAHQPASNIEIVDTQDNTFRPIGIDPSANPFAYDPNAFVPADDTLPLRDTPAFDSPTRGQLMLFKITLTSLANRPLELHFDSRSGRTQTGIVDLDV
jgi:hypothetical protein